MADTVTTQVIENGFSRYVVQFDDNSDGTGESGVVKVDPTSSGDMGVIIAGRTLYPGTNLVLRKIAYNVGPVGNTAALKIEWDATTPQNIITVNGWGEHLYYGKNFGGLSVPSIAGANGKVLFTTLNFTAGSFYSITMVFKKRVSQ